MATYGSTVTTSSGGNVKMNIAAGYASVSRSGNTVTANIYGKMWPSSSWSSNEYAIWVPSGGTKKQLKKSGVAGSGTWEGYVKYSFGVGAADTSKSITVGFGWNAWTASQGATASVSVPFSAGAYTVHIDHWTWGYTKGEGTNGGKNAYPLGTTTFSATAGGTYELNSSRAVSVPNGFYLDSVFGGSSVAGSWTTYTMPKSFNSGEHYWEYDYRPHSYSITYTMNGGTNNSSNPSSYNVLYGVTFANPTRTGYTFKNWTIGGTAVSGINVGANASFSSADDLRNKCASRTTGNKTVVANWTVNNYYLDVNWTLDGSSIGNSSGYATADVYVNDSKVATGVTDYYTQHAYGSTYKVVATTAAGYAFSDGTTTKTLTGTIGTSTVNALFAIVTRSYTVAYNANGGTSTPTTQTAKYKAAVTLASAIAKNNTDANVTITVTYNANGGSGAPSNSTGTAVNTTPYTFNKWALNSASGTQYGAGTSYTIPAANSTMYATWTTGTTTRKSNPSITLSSTQPTKSGYKFLGWATSSTATTATYGAGTTHTFSANTTLYAVWELAQAQLYTKTVLPSTYQEVDYIETTGTQYINTGIAATNSSADLLFQLTGFGVTNDWTGLFGSRGTAGSVGADAYNLWVDPNGIVPDWIGSRNETTYTNTLNTDIHCLLKQDGSVNINGTALSASVTKTACAHPLMIGTFCNGSSTSFVRCSSAKWKRVIIYTNGKKVRDMIPCYRKNDSVIGMYDIINDTFYTNNGTGTFLKGSNVSAYWVKGPAYVKVDGAWKTAKQVYTKVNGEWVLNK
jgi:uncharacterized repeat protein (TIGR02543 family)